MSLREVLGQPEALETLERALRSGRVHHAYRFEGPEGTGREKCAFAVAQALVCTGGDPLGCGRCDACARAITLSDDAPHVPKHPDVVLVGRGLYDEKEKSGIQIDQIRRVVLGQVGYPPHEGRARVFIVRAADELNVSAANALLKTLEEPRPRTHFLLLTSRPDRLLPTIRSRSLPVRFRPLGAEVMRTLLTRQGVSASRLDEVIELSGGSMTAALEHADDERASHRAAFVDAVLSAARAGTAAAAAELGESAGSDRLALRHALLGLAAHLARRSREVVDRAPDQAGELARGHALVLTAADELELANASANLTLARLALELRPAVARGD